MVIQSDGKIVVAGFVGSSSDFALARYGVDGSLDSGFGSGGTVSTNFASLHDEINAIALDGSGNIVVAGYARQSNGNFDFALARYTPAGVLDASFDTDGMVTTAIGSGQDVAKAIAIQSDGKIVAAGFSYNGSNNDFAVARYNNDGSLDTSFDSDGMVTTPVGSGLDEAYSIAIQSDGKIVVAGKTQGSNADIALVRYDTNGTLDTTFGGVDGIVIQDVNTAHNEGNAVAIQSDGKILVTGYGYDGAQGFLLLRYDTGGTLDLSFDDDGMVITHIGSQATGLSIAIAGDEKILVAGRASNGSNNDFALARYNADGSLDTGFDGDGTVVSAMGSATEDWGNAVGIQSDGKIVVAGFSGTTDHHDFAVARYNP
jgi:uncharacterized delta-60 repeat protein